MIRRWLLSWLLPEEVNVAFVGNTPVSVHTTAEGALESLAGKDGVSMIPGVPFVVD